MQNIRTIREELGLSQLEMAKALRLNQSTVSRLEKGDVTISLDLALRVFDATAKQIGPLAGLSRKEIEVARKMVAAA